MNMFNGTGGSSDGGNGSSGGGIGGFLSDNKGALIGAAIGLILVMALSGGAAGIGGALMGLIGGGLLGGLASKMLGGGSSGGQPVPTAATAQREPNGPPSYEQQVEVYPPQIGLGTMRPEFRDHRGRH